MMHNQQLVSNTEIDINYAIKERFKCKNNVIYFLENYCKVLYGKKGKVPFVPFEFQKEHVIKPALKYRFTVFLKGRQMGFSTIFSALIAHLLVFFPNKLVVILSYNQGAADEMLEKVKLTLSDVPE
jgi:hypothetical protein